MAREQDHALVRRAKAGDVRAFEELVRRHSGRVHSVARGMVGDHHLAFDIVQETFLAAIRHLDQFDERSQLSTWLHRITVRKCLDELRRRKPDPADPEGATLATLAGHDDDPQGTGLAGSAILDALARLDESYRAAVVLVDIAGCSVEEAAAQLGVQTGTIKSRVFRGRAQLASSLRAGGWGPDPESGTETGVSASKQ